MKKAVKYILIFGVIFTILGGIGAGILYKSQHPKALKFKRYIKHLIVNTNLPPVPSETEGLSTVQKVMLYENNCLVSRDELNPEKDYKKIYLTDKNKRLVNYTSGYQFDVPKNATFAFEYSPIFTKVNTDQYELTISREYSPYADIDGYIAHYLNRFILSEEYQTANDIKFKEKTDQVYNGNPVQTISITLNNLDNSKQDGYTYVTIKTNTRIFYRMMFKYKSSIKNFDAQLTEILQSFQYFQPQGQGFYDLEFSPELPKSWSKETSDFYNLIKNSKELRWGIFAKNIYNEGIDEIVPEIEKKIEYKFPVILSYIHFKTQFPLEFMRKNYENNRVVELTYQITESNNEQLFGYTPNIDMYRGIKDDDIREFARGAKEFGHPFLFRLNNEMNSDWTSYSGVINLSDPAIYIDNWRRFYRIFEEEGVSNAIWIFNPNDRNYPPCDWNNYLAYYPGNEFVQMIGVTGYNNGSYYIDVTGEEWREFSMIYDEVQEKYEPFFSKFPWIITEFSSSSVGGNKVKWIENMFDNIKKYKNIKIAVWFSYVDYDSRPGFESKEARPYWLDETPNTIKAFKEGVKKNGIEGWIK